MDEYISYEVVITMLEGQPSLLPRPNFMRLREWTKHNANILAQIPHPDYPQHGWKGMIVQPPLFALINNKPFLPPTDPGRVAVYQNFATVAASVTTPKLLFSLLLLPQCFIQLLSNQ
jgi:hypothetical protein